MIFLEGYVFENLFKLGMLYCYWCGDKVIMMIYSGYVSGLLIEDRLFIYFVVELNCCEGVVIVNEVVVQQVCNYYCVDMLKFYGKIDWNINDSNMLEYICFQDIDCIVGYYWEFDYKMLFEWDCIGMFFNLVKFSIDVDIFKYIGYFNDVLIFSVVWGCVCISNFEFNLLGLGNFYISGVGNQDFLLNGGMLICNDQFDFYSKVFDVGSMIYGLCMDL